MAKENGSIVGREVFQVFFVNPVRVASAVRNWVSKTTDPKIKMTVIDGFLLMEHPEAKPGVVPMSNIIKIDFEA
jgi:hypothetical protein